MNIKKQLELGLNFTLISNLNQGGRILTLIGPLKLIRFFQIESIGKQFLKIISNFADPTHISCQCTFPVDDKTDLLSAIRSTSTNCSC